VGVLGAGLHPLDLIGVDHRHDPTDQTVAGPRLKGLEATFVHEKDEHGIHWLTFQDPVGNEFCVGAHGEGAPPPSTG
jgi:hypothetical protein